VFYFFSLVFPWSKPNCILKKKFFLQTNSRFFSKRPAGFVPRPSPDRVLPINRPLMPCQKPLPQALPPLPKGGAATMSWRSAGARQVPAALQLCSRPRGFASAPSNSKQIPPASRRLAFERQGPWRPIPLLQAYRPRSLALLAAAAAAVQSSETLSIAKKRCRPAGSRPAKRPNSLAIFMKDVYFGKKK